MEFIVSFLHISEDFRSQLQNSIFFFKWFVILVTTSNLFKVLVARDLSHEPSACFNIQQRRWMKKRFDVGLVSQQDHTCAMYNINGSSLFLYSMYTEQIT